MFPFTITGEDENQDEDEEDEVKDGDSDEDKQKLLSLQEAEPRHEKDDLVVPAPPAVEVPSRKSQ